jgi:uncharacterized membrane protein
MAYSYKNSKGQTYYLHMRDVKLRGSGKTQRIYFFARETRSGSLNDVPTGYKVVENKKTGLPVLKRS